jgi:GTPase
MSFTIAIIGRPNVGKSTLFNRLIGKRLALVDDMPGVTRDRREGKAHIADLEFTAVDTAGLEDAKPETLQARMTAQTLTGVEEADAVLLMIDGRAGLTPMDEHFAKLVRKMKKPVVLVVNKAEGTKAQAAIAEAYRLGFGEPVAISAEHGEGMSELYDALSKFEPKSEKEDEEAFFDEAVEEEIKIEKSAGPLQLAIVGRPNVGKSTLLNKILGEERTLTGPEAGLTRDSIMVEYVRGQSIEASRYGRHAPQGQC